jgi:RimJ/RimL family protein N-acetyltransferase
LISPDGKEAGDVDALWEILSRQDVMEHYVDYQLINISNPPLGLSPIPATKWTRDITRNFVKGCNDFWRNNEYGRWGLELRDTKNLIGYCGLNELDYLPEVEPAVELSFRIHPEYWGQGIGPEAARATLDWAFDNLEVDSIVGCTVPENTQSVRALGKLGMTHEMTLPYHSPISNRDVEFEVHRIPRDQWTGVSSGRLGHMASKPLNSTSPASDALTHEQEWGSTPSKAGQNPSGLPTRSDMEALTHALIGDFPTNPPGFMNRR